MSADANGQSRHIAEAVHGKVEPAIRTRPTHPPGKGGEGLAQPAAVPKPASRSSPTDPVLRANPFPEVTDPICRLPLPTLFYRLEAVHLGDLLRIWVRPGTRITPSPWDFQGPTETHRTPQEPRCFTETPCPYLRASRFQGASPLQRKENSSRGLGRRLPLRLRCRTWPRRTNLRVQVREY
ncbi:hypothetical protein ACOMHN_017681 [Nucella lapillus]